MSASDQKSASREDRLKQAMRANLRRRKAQAKERREQPNDTCEPEKDEDPGD